jgi:hypothetical protein
MPTPAPSLTETQSSLVANGVSTLVISATVFSPLGVPVAGDLVSFTAVGNPSAVCSTASLPAVAQTGLLTDAAGVASFEYTSSTTPGFCTVTSTEHSTGGTSIITFTQTTV